MRLQASLASAQLSHPVSLPQNTTELYQEAEVWPGNFPQDPGILDITGLGRLSNETLPLDYRCCLIVL